MSYSCLREMPAKRGIERKEMKKMTTRHQTMIDCRPVLFMYYWVSSSPATMPTHDQKPIHSP